MTPLNHRKIEILLGTHQFFPRPPAGTEVLTLELARGLRDRGHRASILSGAAEVNRKESSPAWLTQDEYDGFTVYRLHFGIAQERDAVSLHLAAPDRVSLVQQVVSQVHPDVVHLNHLKGLSGEVIPKIRQMGVPVLFTPTDFWTVCPKTTLLKTFDNEVCSGPGDAVNCVRCFMPMPTAAARLLLQIGKSPLQRLGGTFRSLKSLGRRRYTMVGYVNAAYRVLPSTQFLADVLIRHGVEANRVKVISYGVELGELPANVPMPERFSEASPLRLGFIGTLKEFKGPHVLLEALGFLGGQRANVTLDLYGMVDQADPYCKRLQNQASACGSNVRLRGLFPPERLGAILRSLHVLVIPSLWHESAPLVLCAALRAGVPVFVSRLGGLVEAVKEGVHGSSFPAGDPSQLARLIVQALERPEQIRAIQLQNPEGQRSMADYVAAIETEYLAALSNRDGGRT